MIMMQEGDVWVGRTPFDAYLFKPGFNDYSFEAGMISDISPIRIPAGDCFTVIYCKFFKGNVIDNQNNYLKTKDNIELCILWNEKILYTEMFATSLSDHTKVV